MKKVLGWLLFAVLSPVLFAGFVAGLVSTAAAVGFVVACRLVQELIEE